MYTVVYYRTNRGFRNAYKNNAALIARSFSLDNMITYKTGVSINNDQRFIKRILTTSLMKRGSLVRLRFSAAGTVWAL